MSTTEFLQHPNIDPIIFGFEVFGFDIALRWYGLTYLVGFFFAWYWGNRQCKMAHYKAHGWNEKIFGDVLFWGFVGVILGGRIGYVIFYQFEYFVSNPLYLFNFGSGGMSFHGGMLGVIAVLALYARKLNMSLLRVGDFIAPLVPIGLGMGRIGNFINGELWGRVTDVPWAMIFPAAGPEPRHPSQLYQATLEGFVLFAILAWYSRKPRPTGAVGGLFLLGYGVARFAVEFARQPDSHLGLLSLGMSMGQWLSLPMILVGGGIMIIAHKRRLPTTPTSKKGKA
ncbi:prolipoprotein diacylglyceryl transferase [Pseudidiomarina aestuarii]|uniref:Phosphatidylglycerol--prolipoprotein diacylglyceryl transferase n=1 Tax=Pseudidiomarina aestuarii TaxID=624146 RepID=A0A7Z7EU30_9GAMM|nr:prolipoprotein diacylglyceryl transferase [Pseudidiomarina aestuarii]RUO41707.1 prolipoprotein diacylglyceryl transferase [Pseudidiomarina aestuarii]